MRLLIAEGPEGRHLRLSRQARPLAHGCHGIVRVDYEDIERQRSVRGRVEPTPRPREVERAEWLMDVEGPALGAGEPLNRHPAAVRTKLVPALAAAHRVRRAAPVELGTTLPHAEQRAVAERERQRAADRVDREVLQPAAVRPADADLEGLTFHLDA